MENNNIYDTKLFKDVIKLVSNNQQLSNKLILNTIKINYDSEEYWKYIIEKVNLSSDFILQNLNDVNLKYIMMFQKLDNEVLNNNKFLTKISNDELINLAIKYQKFDDKILNYFIINEFIDSEFWNLISQYQDLCDDFIKNNSDNLNWTLLSTYQDLNLDTIINNLDKIDWNNIPLNITFALFINDNTIKLFEKYPIWEKIAYLKNVSTEVLFNYFNKLTKKSIINIIKFRNLNIEQLSKIITMYKEDLEIWSLICENQTLTTELIDKYINYINWDELSESFDFSSDDILKYHNYINYKKLSYNDNFNDTWLNTINSEVKQINDKVINVDTTYLTDLNIEAN